jgi:putative copper export protein
VADLLLTLHILGAAAWVGGSILQGFVGPRLERSGDEAWLAWARAQSVTGRFYGIAAAVVLLTGIGLVLVRDEYDWSDAFVSVGLAVVVVTMAIAGVVHGPAGRRIQTSLETGDDETARAESKREGIWATVTVVLLIVTVVLMVLKTGAG